LLKDGIELNHFRHKRGSLAFRQAMRALNLSLVAPDDQVAAVTVTAIWLPPNVEHGEFLSHVDDYGVVISGGLHRQMRGKYFRVGHMGISLHDNRNDLIQTVEAIEYGLLKCGYQNFQKGAGVKACQQVLYTAKL